VSTIRNYIASQKRAVFTFGEVDTQKGKFWLDTTFPDGPPQDYEISGIAITDNYIAWATKTMTQQNYARQQRAIFPTAAFWGMFASSKFLFNQQLQYIKQVLGLAPKPDQHIQQMLELRAMQQRFGGKNQNDQQQPPSSSDATGAAGADGTMSTQSTAKPPNAASRPAITLPIPSPQNPTQAHGAPDGMPKQPVTLAIFYHTFAHSQNKMKMDPPRGSVVFSGLVEVMGSKARATMDVTAAYDLSQGKFVIVNAAPRRIQARSQVPKGGR